MTSLVKRLSGMLFYLSISEIILKALDMLKKDVCHRSRCIGLLSSTSKHLDFQLTQEELWISCWQTGLDVLIFSMSMPWKAAFDSVSQHWTYPQKPPSDSKEGQANRHNTSPNCLFCAKAAYSNNMRIVCLELPQSPMAPRGTGEHRRSLWLVSLGWQTCGQSVVLGWNKEQHITVLNLPATATIYMILTVNCPQCFFPSGFNTTWAFLSH